MPTRSDLTLRRQLRGAAAASLEKKAIDPVLLDVRKLAGFCDYFFICHGSNPRQIRTIADAIEEHLEADFGLHPAHREGKDPAEWVVLDYLDFIIHVFSAHSRRFYDMERLWSGAPRIRLSTGPAAAE